MEQNIIGLAIISAVVGVVMVGVLVKAVHQRGGMRDDSDETVRHRMHVDLFAMGTERDEEVDTLSGRKGAPAVYDVFLKRTSEIAAAEKLQVSFRNIFIRRAEADVSSTSISHFQRCCSSPGRRWA